MASMNGLSKLGLPKLSDNMDPGTGSSMLPLQLL